MITASWPVGIENGPDKLDDSVAPAPTPDTDTGLLEPNDQDEDDRVALPAAKQRTHAVPPLRGIRMQTMSYVEYVTGEKELYDIKADPYQLNNLAAKANPKLLAVLSARVKELATCKAAACRAVEDAPLNLP